MGGHRTRPFGLDLIILRTLFVDLLLILGILVVAILLLIASLHWILTIDDFLRVSVGLVAVASGVSVSLHKKARQESTLIWFVVLLLISAGIYCLLRPQIEEYWGFFYWAGFSLLIIPLYYACVYAGTKVSSKTRDSKELKHWAGVFAFVILIVVVVLIWCFVQGNCNAFLTEYNEYLGVDYVSQLNSFMRRIMDAPETDKTQLVEGYRMIILLGENPIIHGGLGIVYGVLSMLVTYIGSRSGAKGNHGKQGETETAKLILNFDVVLSIIIAVIILAAGQPTLMGSIRYAFIVISFILAVLLFTLGFLVSSTNEKNGAPFPGLLMALVVSFTLGFVVGNTAIPVTRAPLGFFTSEGVPLGRTLYGVYPGQYVFMCTSMLAIASLALVRTDQLSKHPHSSGSSEMLRSLHPEGIRRRERNKKKGEEPPKVGNPDLKVGKKKPRRSGKKSGKAASNK